MTVPEVPAVVAASAVLLFPAVPSDGHGAIMKEVSRLSLLLLSTCPDDLSAARFSSD
jgi:hypothetical protein